MQCLLIMCECSSNSCCALGWLNIATLKKPVQVLLLHRAKASATLAARKRLSGALKEIKNAAAEEQEDLSTLIKARDCAVQELKASIDKSQAGMERRSLRIR